MYSCFDSELDFLILNSVCEDENDCAGAAKGFIFEGVEFSLFGGVLSVGEVVDCLVDEDLFPAIKFDKLTKA